MIIDDFLPKEMFNRLCSYAKEAEFKTEKNGVDGVEYPLICKDIPEEIEEEIAIKLCRLAGKDIDYHIFMRRSPEGVIAPHQAHTDNSMGDYSFMLYLDDLGGTSILHHKETGMAFAPESESMLEIAKRDANIAEAWNIHGYIDGKANRGAAFNASAFHRAEPVGGAGHGKDGRTVLTVFFA